ncbi:unannotated protein [freshwater metagenome]|uniref:Unannotated protein n=1 Tax=freshwater metagenome TaxID=449393 RepID=A0A6J7NZM4_9ZZZZ
MVSLAGATSALRVQVATPPSSTYLGVPETLITGLSGVPVAARRATAGIACATPLLAGAIGPTKVSPLLSTDVAVERIVAAPVLRLPSLYPAEFPLNES